MPEGLFCQIRAQMHVRKSKLGNFFRNFQSFEPCHEKTDYLLMRK